MTETTERLHLISPGSVTSLNVSSLHADYTYHYIIVAAGTAPGIGPFSSSRSIRMPEDGKYLLFSMSIQVKRARTQPSIIIQLLSHSG